MKYFGLFCYALTLGLALWADWRIGIAFLTFYIGFKIELYNIEPDK